MTTRSGGGRQKEPSGVLRQVDSEQANFRAARQPLRILATVDMGCKEEGRLLSLPTNATCNSSLPLHIEGLVKRFGQLNAVDSITLELPSGECLGLLGPNGAGKSTLIRSIVGRVIPDAGSILIFGAKADSTAARSSEARD